MKRIVSLLLALLLLAAALPLSVAAQDGEVEDPVTSITLNSAPTREYIWGDWGEYGIFYGSAYAVDPTDLTGLSFTVHYQDGGSKTYTSEDIGGRFHDEIDGHSFSLSYDSWTFEPCSVPVTFTYLNHSFSYTVNYVASSVASVELVRLPDRTEYSYGYNIDFAGAQVKITYKNGDTKTVTAADNLVYEWLSNDVDSGAYIEVDGHWLYFEVYYESDISVYYLGAIDRVEPSPFTVDPDNTIESYDISRVSPDGTGMRITAHHPDGSSLTFTVDPTVTNYGEGTDYYDGTPYVDYTCYTRTEKGMFVYSIRTYYRDGSVAYYEVELPCIYPEITVYPGDDLPGDLDGDGTLDAGDLVDLRQLLLNGEDFAPADVNGDGEADIRDLIAFKKLLVNI